MTILINAQMLILLFNFSYKTDCTSPELPRSTNIGSLTNGFIMTFQDTQEKTSQRSKFWSDLGWNERKFNESIYGYPIAEIKATMGQIRVFENSTTNYQKNNQNNQRIPIKSVFFPIVVLNISSSWQFPSFKHWYIRQINAYYKVPQNL